MNPTFQKLMAKKKAEGSKMSPVEQKAKGSVLSDLMGSMDGMDKEKLAGMKKVTVAAPDKSGLEHGLDMASNMVEKGPLETMSHDEVGDSENDSEESDQDEYEENHESDQDPAHEETQEDEESPESIHAKIQELQAKLQKHSMRG